MTTTYLYLDDGDQAESSAFSNAVLNATPELQINLEYPSEFSKQISQVTEASFSADGLILDLRLDQLAHPINDDKRQADYRAPSPAQEIRTRAAERGQREFPIVLWSFDERLKESYRKDHTSHDLFDLIVVKEDLSDDVVARTVGRRLLSLVEGYQDIVRVRDNEPRRVGWFYRLLGFDAIDDASFLDPRLLEYFDSPDDIERPAHEYARFVIRHLLERSGPLIDRLLLTSRLGLDLEASSDIEKLFEQIFVDAKYQGVFQGGWERWWAFKVEEIWNREASDAGPLRTLKAGERVEKLKALTGFKNLAPAELLHPDYSTRYWAICQELKTPLDPRDSLLLRQNKQYPWQSEQFVSFEAYRQRLVSRRDIDKLDHGRLEMFKEQRSS